MLPCGVLLQRQARSQITPNVLKKSCRQSLRPGEDLSGRIWAGFAWQSTRQVVDLSFSVLFPSCRWVKQQSELAKQAENPDQGPKLDLGFKEGQTIKLNIAVRAFAS